LPLVVISHGNGGGPFGHADLALALANAGYVVAAPMHTGDNYADQSAVGSPAFFSGRTRQLRATVDHMLKTWPAHGQIDPARIGAFGFSMGGFTVLTAVGAQPDLRIVPKHCADAPEFACKVLRQARSPFLSAGAPASDFEPDRRIKAAVVAAPGFGFTMARTEPDAVRVPVQLWSADKDDSVPYATNAGMVRAALGSGVEFHAVRGAGHFSFMAPCTILAPRLPICAEQGQFDRRAFHESMNASVVAFFDKNIKSR
jgi:predicted dienelactone hydrolase